MVMLLIISTIFMLIGSWAWYSTITTLKNFKNTYGESLGEYLNGLD